MKDSAFTFDKMIYFDRKCCKWGIWKDNINMWEREELSPKGLYRSLKSPCYYDTSNKTIYIVMVGRPVLAKIVLPQNMFKWKQERQLWIVFNKNKNNDQCLIKKLPKDVILYMISFVSGIDW